MKNVFVAIFFLILLISVLYFDVLEWNQFDQNTKLVAVTYTAQNCLRCQELNHKMRKVAWAFAQKPIVFIQYDIHQKENTKKIRKTGLQDLLRQEVEVGFVQVYDIAQHQTLLKISPDLSWEEIQAQIQVLLASKSSTKDTLR